MLSDEVYQAIPRLPQRQDSLNDQLADLARVAVKLGMYDAADYLNKIVSKNDTTKTPREES